MCVKRGTIVGVAAFAAAIAIGAGTVGCSRGESGKGAVSARSESPHTRRDTAEAAGEVVDSSAALATVKWLTDANVLSLLAVMNSAAIKAADAELQAWHSDTVRAFASSIARDHAELQHSVDSLAQRIRLAPVAPALAEPIAATLQAQVDSVTANRGPALDRAFVREQVASHRLMAGYIDQLSSVAERPEVQAMLTSAATRVGVDLEHAIALQAAFALSDSTAAADSAARRTARGSNRFLR